MLAIGMLFFPFQKIEFEITTSKILLRGHAGYGLVYSKREGFPQQCHMNWWYTKSTENIILLMSPEPVSQAILDLQPDMDELDRPEAYNMPVAKMNPRDLAKLLDVLSQMTPGEMR